MSDKSLKNLIVFLSVLVLGLIALGGAVRAMDAGLACPDWPLCFGQLIPDFHPQVYFEFIHRAIAGVVAILTAILGVAIFKRPDYPRVARSLVVILWVVLAVQIVMGGLTVLKLLHSGTVTTHLALGILFFILLCWLSFLITNHFPKTNTKVPRFVTYLGIIMMTVVFAQILLGGLVSSNYAGLACPDFPLCHGSWIPTLEGDVGLQVIHRLGAYITFGVIYLCYVILRFQRHRAWMTRGLLLSARMALSLIMLQVVIGMSNVLFKLPPVITVIHLAVAAVLLYFCLRLVLLSYYEPKPR